MPGLVSGSRRRARCEPRNRSDLSSPRVRAASKSQSGGSVGGQPLAVRAFGRARGSAPPTRRAIATWP
eukprot:3723600-Alexandrium_andersonii.AAC.1